MVPGLSVALIIIDMLLGVIIPAAILMILNKRYKARIRNFWIGCAVMLVFAFILEQIVHSIVFGSGIGSKIINNIWLYALYGSLMAGLFEESGRFIAMRYLMKKEYDNPHNALMYGAGHGGLEMFMILSVGMINNLVYSIAINSGQTKMMLAPLDDATRGTLQSAFDMLIQTPSWHFILSPVERMAAITAQIGLSVIVWFAATDIERNKSLLFLAILLHMGIDAVAVILAKLGMSLILVEAVIWLVAIGIVLIAGKAWKKNVESES